MKWSFGKQYEEFQKFALYSVSTYLKYSLHIYTLFVCFFRCECEGNHIFSKISLFTAKLLGNYSSTTLNLYKIILCIKEKEVVMLQC